MEEIEKHPKAQLAYSFDFALQNELSLEENITIARQFVLENFVAKGSRRKDGRITLLKMLKWF